MAVDPKVIGDFRLKSLKFYSPNIDQSIDITPLISTIELYEDITCNALNGRLTILDSVGFRELVPLMGEEKITLELESIGAESALKGENITEVFLKRTFCIYKITPTSNINERTLAYILHLCSPQFMINRALKIQKNFKAPISNIVKDVYYNYLNNTLKQKGYSERDDIRPLFIDPTENYISFVSANWPPFTLFNYLAKRAIASHQAEEEDNTNTLFTHGALYLFYETFTGFHFESIEKAIQKNPIRYLTYQPTNIGTLPSDIIKRGSRGVENFQIVKYFDTLENLTLGMYASRLITHDIVRMKYAEQDFFYLPKTYNMSTVDNANTNVVTLNPQGSRTEIFDKSASIAQGRLCTDSLDVLGMPEANICLYPTNRQHDSVFSLNAKVAGGFTQGGIKVNRVEDWLQYRESQFQQLNNIKVNITIAGDTRIRAGQTIHFEVPSYLLSTDYKKSDAFLAGKFLISKIKHIFLPRSYKMELELVKDSLETQPPGLDIQKIQQAMQQPPENQLEG